MTMHKDINLRDDIDYMLRKEGGRGLTSIEDCMNASIEGLKDYIKEQKKTNYNS